MAITDMVVFNQQIQTVATEIIDQEVAAFNAASSGALLLGSEAAIGDYIEEASYALISNLVTRRDAYATGALTASQIGQLKDVSVKVDQSVGPVEWTAEQFARLGKSEEEAGLIIGEQAAQGLIQDYLNTATSCLTAAIGNQGASLVNDYGATGTAKLVELNRAAGLFGDRQTSLVAWIMHSKVFTDLTNEAITNSERLYNIGNIQVIQDGLGRRYVVTDSPALFVAGAPDTYNTLGLTSGSAMVESQAVRSQTLGAVSTENMGTTWKAESSFMMGLKGYAWDATNGGKSPSDAELATGTNWDKIVTSNKDTAGVMLISQ